MSIKLAKKWLSLSLILIFLDTTSVDSAENYRIFDRDYSLATESVFFDGNIDRSVLGLPGIFGNYLEKSFPNVEAFINNLKDEYGHAKLHKLKRNNIDYNIFEVFNPKVASKGFLISKSDNVIIGYCFFDKPFIVNKDHPGSPISRIESLDLL